MAKRTNTEREARADAHRQTALVRTYLRSLETQARKRDPERVRARLAGIEAAIPEAPPVKRLELVQQRIQLENLLAELEASDDLSAYEAQFVEVAKPYAERKGITRAAFREVGVPAKVLTAAGITA